MLELCNAGCCRLSRLSLGSKRPDLLRLPYEIPPLDCRHLNCNHPEIHVGDSKYCYSITSTSILQRLLLNGFDGNAKENFARFEEVVLTVQTLVTQTERQSHNIRLDNATKRCLRHKSTLFEEPSIRGSIPHGLFRIDCHKLFRRPCHQVPQYVTSPRVAGRGADTVGGSRAGYDGERKSSSYIRLGTRCSSTLPKSLT